MIRGTHVQITKFAVNPDGAKAGDMASWKAGTDNNPENESLPVEYTIKGFLLDDIRVGESVTASRYERNGIKVAGLFTSSPVMEIGDGMFKTRNSLYRITRIN